MLQDVARVWSVWSAMLHDVALKCGLRLARPLRCRKPSNKPLWNINSLSLSSVNRSSHSISLFFFFGRFWVLCSPFIFTDPLAMRRYNSFKMGDVFTWKSGKIVCWTLNYHGSYFCFGRVA